MKKREEIDKKYKWDFRSIFKNWDEIDKSIKVVEEKLREIKSFEGKIGESVENFKQLFSSLEEVSKIFENIYFEEKSSVFYYQFWKNWGIINYRI